MELYRPSRRTIIALALLAVGLAWFALAFHLHHTMAVTIPFDIPRPRTPEAFAERYPLLAGFCWLIRVDLFAPVSVGAGGEYVREIYAHV